MQNQILNVMSHGCHHKQVAAEEIEASGSTGFRKVSLKRGATPYVAVESPPYWLRSASVSEGSRHEVGTIYNPINPDVFFVKGNRRSSHDYSEQLKTNTNAEPELRDLVQESDMTEASLCWVVCAGPKRGKLTKFAISRLKDRYPELFTKFSSAHSPLNRSVDSDGDVPDWQVVLDNPAKYFLHHQAIAELFNKYREIGSVNRIFTVTDGGWNAVGIGYGIYKRGHFNTFSPEEIKDINRGTVWINDQSHSEAMEMEKKLNESEQEVTLLREQLVYLTAMNAQLTQRSEQLSDSNDTLQTTVSELSDEITALNGRLQNSSENYVDISDRLDLTEKEKNDLAQANKLLSQTGKDLGGQLELVKNSAEGSKAVIKKVRDTLHDEKFEYDYKVEGLMGVLSPNPDGNVPLEKAQERHSLLFGRDLLAAKLQFEVNQACQSIGSQQSVKSVYFRSQSIEGVRSNASDDDESVQHKKRKLSVRRFSLNPQS
ncbi:hypothetical protein [Endozoicomonas ascidiicola]|uniref:hypothetical protein n=1 Tax=Endozoicomonas ascidiicola TaxID=1698521 RepID=UPI0008359448|nr:hypothetical protein [Endozoicomonas ascidiicola]